MLPLEATINLMNNSGGAASSLRKHLKAVGVSELSDLTRSTLYALKDYLARNGLATGTQKTVLSTRSMIITITSTRSWNTPWMTAGSRRTDTISARTARSRYTQVCRTSQCMSRSRGYQRKSGRQRTLCATSELQRSISSSPKMMIISICASMPALKEARGHLLTESSRFLRTCCHVKRKSLTNRRNLGRGRTTIA